MADMVDEAVLIVWFVGYLIAASLVWAMLSWLGQKDKDE